MREYSNIEIQRKVFHDIYEGLPIPSYVFKDGFQTRGLDCLNTYKIIATWPSGAKMLWRSLDNDDYYHYCDGVYHNKEFNFYKLVFNPTTKNKEWWSFDCLVKNGIVEKITLSEHPNKLLKNKIEKLELENNKQTVELELPDDLILKLALEAHEKDITLNQHIINILKDFIQTRDGE